MILRVIILTPTEIKTLWHLHEVDISYICCTMPVYSAQGKHSFGQLVQNPIVVHVLLLLGLSNMNSLLNPPVKNQTFSGWSFNRT